MHKSISKSLRGEWTSKKTMVYLPSSKAFNSCFGSTCVSTYIREGVVKQRLLEKNLKAKILKC